MGGRVGLVAVPLTREEAHAYVRSVHRHLPVSPPGDRFRIGAAKDGVVVGVVIVGRPASRMIARDRSISEVTRLATDGTKNACSFLYAAAARAARELGYRKLITYTLEREGGASLRASGWIPVSESTPHKGWSRPLVGRPRSSSPLDTEVKIRWERDLADEVDGWDMPIIPGTDTGNAPEQACLFDPSASA